MPREILRIFIFHMNPTLRQVGKFLLAPYQTTAIAILLTDSATIASQALFGKTCFFAFK